MTTSSNGIIFCVTDPLYGEFTGHRWIALANASDAELWCFLFQIARFMGPTWGPSGSCRPQMGPMLAPWILLSGLIYGWTNGWANNRNTGALRRHCAHSDIGLFSISNECHLIKMHIYSNPQHFCPLIKHWPLCYNMNRLIFTITKRYNLANVGGWESNTICFEYWNIHYSKVKEGSQCVNSPTTLMCVQQYIQASKKENFTDWSLVNKIYQWLMDSLLKWLINPTVKSWRNHIRGFYCKLDIKLCQKVWVYTSLYLLYCDSRERFVQGE